MASGDTLFFIPAALFVGDENETLVTGDAPAPLTTFVGRLALAFDDTDEEAALSHEIAVPQHYAGGGIVGVAHFAMASDATNDIALDLFVEAKTPNADTLDMESADSFDSANGLTVSLSGTTAGDPLTASGTLSNNDSIAAGDLVRVGVRRDCDSVNDDASGDLYLFGIEIREV